MEFGSVWWWFESTYPSGGNGEEKKEGREADVKGKRK